MTQQVTLLRNLRIRTAPNTLTGGIITEGADENSVFHAGRVFPVAEIVDRPEDKDEQWVRLNTLMYYKGVAVPVYIAVRIGSETFSRVSDIPNMGDNAALNQAIDYRIAELRTCIASLEKMKR